MNEREIKPRKNEEELCVPVLNISEAVCRFRAAGIPTSETRLGAGIEQGLYPFAICIKFKDKEKGKETRNFEIYEKLLVDYLAARSVER